jgi:aminopeptidase N
MVLPPLNTIQSLIEKESPVKPFLYALLFVSVLSVAAAQLKIPKGAITCAEGKQLRSRPITFNKYSAVGLPKHTFDVLHYSIELDLYKNYSSPFPQSFTGAVTVTLKTDSAISAIALDAVNSSLTIDSVRLAGISFTHEGNILTVQLAKTYQMNETLSVKIHYRHNNVSDGAFFVGSDGMIFTDAEPEGARRWFPCWDKPSDKATMELRAKVPGNVKLGSNGLLKDTTRAGDSLTFHWVSAEPVPTYLVVISSKVNYNLDIVHWKKPSNPSDSIPIFFYWNTGENTAALNNIKTKIGPMTTHFSELFGEHPFQKNGFATLNQQFVWGGMENQTLTSLTPNGYQDESLIAHEYAHQWFGDMITCATWADIWLNEAYATYSESLWDEYTLGYQYYKGRISAYANIYLNNNPGWAIYVPSWAVNPPGNDQLFSFAITYAKGSSVLHMLRYVLGDSAFFATLKTYGTTPEFKFNSITTDDFVQQFNASAKQDMTWFFDQWLKQANHPEYLVKYSVNKYDSTGTVTVTQTQTSGYFWKMPVVFRFSLENGRDTVIRVFNAANGDSFRFAFPSAPVAMAFDPNNDIVLKKAVVVKVPSGPFYKAVPGTMYAVSGKSDGGKLYTVNTSNGALTLIQKTDIPQINSLRVHPSTKELVALNNLNTTSSGTIYRMGSDGWNTDLLSTVATANLKGLAIFNDSMAYTGTFTGAVMSVNMKTGALTQIGTNGSSQRVAGLAINPVNGSLWMSLRNTSGAVDNIYKVNRATGLSTLVGSAGIGTAISDIVFDKNGTLYGIGGNGATVNSLLRIDTLSGTATVIGSMGKADIQALAIDPDMPAGVDHDKPAAIPAALVLQQNFPNPFNPATTIRYAVPSETTVRLTVYNLLGQFVQELVNEKQSAGWKEVQWNASHLSSGIYFYKLTAGNAVQMKKTILLK